MKKNTTEGKKESEHGFCKQAAFFRFERTTTAKISSIYHRKAEVRVRKKKQKLSSSEQLGIPAFEHNPEEPVEPQLAVCLEPKKKPKANGITIIINSGCHFGFSSWW